MKKIMFDDLRSLTNLVIEGRKTMTRRLVPKKLIDDYYSIVFDDKEPLTEYLSKLSPYKIGDVIAVSQSYKTIWESYREGICKAVYRTMFHNYAGWNNKMFVSAAEMPHRIQITDVRVESLQNISDEDCLREGVIYEDYYGNPSYYVNGIFLSGNKNIKHFMTPQHAFCNLINAISGKFTWEYNPLVFVYSFKLIK